MVVFEHNIEYILAFVSAILGMSVPIMLQVIERIDQKYASTRIAERLKGETSIKASIWILMIALCTCLYAVFLKIPSPVDCWLLNNSSNLIAQISCMALIVSFLRACSVIMLYYNPEKLQDRIISSLNASVGNEEKHKAALLDFVDLSKAILESSDREPAFKIYDVLTKEMDAIIQKSAANGISIPNYIANGITSINENLCLMKRRPYSINNGNQLLKNLLIEPDKLSDDVYHLLWRNLLLQLHYGADEWVYEYWTAAVQSYELGLQPIHTGTYGVDMEGRQYTEEDVERREK